MGQTNVNEEKLLPTHIQRELRDIGVYEALPADPADLTNAEKAQELHKLKIEHQRFLLAYLQTGDLVGSYRKSYPDATKSQAYGNGYGILRRNNWIVQAMLEEAGINHQSLAKELKQLMRSREKSVRLSSIKLAYDQLEKARGGLEGKSNTQVIIVRDEKNKSFAVGIK